MKSYKLLSIDETGKVSYNHLSKLFILSGVVIPEGLKPKIDAQTRKIKKKYFSDEEIVFHTRDMIRSKGQFASLRNQSTVHAFWSEFVAIIDNPEIGLFFVVTDKAHMKKRGWLPKTVLKKSYLKLLEEFVTGLKVGGHHGKIVVESDPAQDLCLLQAHNKLQSEGTSNHSVSGGEYRKLVTAISLVNKENLDVDVQIADALAPIAGTKYKRDYLNKTQVFSQVEQMKVQLLDKKLANTGNLYEILL